MALCVAVYGLVGFPSAEEHGIPDPFAPGLAVAQVAVCPSGYSTEDRVGVTWCVKYGPARRVVSYWCAAGYTLSGSTCTRTVSLPATATTVTACPVGYSGSPCTRSVAAGRSTVLVCSSGYSREGALCKKTLTAAASVGCPYGYTLLYSCYKIVNASKVRRWDRFNNKWVYECPAGYAESGSGCSKTLTTASVWVCSPGWRRSGSTCFKELTAQPVPMTRYVCASGRLSGSVCVLTAAAVTTTRYSCTSGTLSGTRCLTTTTAAANSNTVYYCGSRRSGASRCVVSQYRLTDPDPPPTTTTTPTTTTVPVTTTTAPPASGCAVSLGALGSAELTRSGFVVVF